jgi:hypothetical protein
MSMFNQLKCFSIAVILICIIIEDVNMQFNPFIGIRKLQCKSMNNSVYDLHSCRTKKLKNGGTSIDMNYTYLLPMNEPFMVRAHMNKFKF